MPMDDDLTSEHDHDHDEFAHRLGEAMQRTGGTFPIDRIALLEEGVRRGRSRVRRRRVTAVTGGLLALVVTGTAGAYGTGVFDSSQEASVASSGPSGAASWRPSPDARNPDDPKNPRTTEKSDPRWNDPKWHMRASAREMIRLLEIALPEGRFSEQRGTSHFGGPDNQAEASLVYDDGYGKALVQISARRADPKSAAEQKSMKCHKGRGLLKDWVDCEAETRRPVPGSPGVVVAQRSRLVNAGFRVDVRQYNAPAAKGAAPSRSNPPLDPVQFINLALFVGSSFTEFGVLNAGVFAEPKRYQLTHDGQRLRETLARLIPPGHSPRGGGGSRDEAYHLVYDIKLKVKTYLRVTVEKATPDGGKVTTEQKAGQREGVKEWSASTVTPDGLRVTATSFNAEYPHSAAVRENPALTLEQLSGIVTSPRWHRFK
ncbi:hypothetical protein [Streptomyces sp. NPDC020965]|uniref:hypothetical protein n=1 Tax=Streptomyces sp. NPDC020965 TaxID=3365105 RepID=UPI00379B755A